MKIFGRLIGTRTQMSCHQVGKVLQTYLDDELDEAAAKKVVAHLDECRRCGLEADAYRRLKDALGRAPMGIDDARIAELRAFGERLACGAIDPGADS